jgi:hypothetical protein
VVCAKSNFNVGSKKRAAFEVRLQGRDYNVPAATYKIDQVRSRVRYLPGHERGREPGVGVLFINP